MHGERVRHYLEDQHVDYEETRHAAAVSAQRVAAAEHESGWRFAKPVMLKVGERIVMAVVHEDFAYAIPAAFSDAEATPLLCAGIIGYRALARAALPAGGALGLYGFGSSAHIVLQLARHRGAEVYVVTRGAGHRALARAMGARWVGDLDEVPPVALDSAIVFAPVGALVPPALRALAKGGTCALAGIYMTDVPSMSYEQHLFYEKNLVSVTANTRADGEGLLREAARIPIRPAITTFPLADANAALQQLAAGTIDGSGVLVVG